MSNADHLPGPQAWLTFRRIVCETWSLPQSHPARRRRAYRPFLDRLGHQAGAGGRDQAGRGAQPPGPDPRGGAGGISGRAKPRGAEASELRAQFDRMVRDAGPLSPLRADPVRLFTAHPLAAGQPRESAAARQGLAGGRRALVPVEGARARAVNEAAPPMFAPFRLREMEVANRVVVSPMAIYSATDGCPNDFHLVHYGARAQGGAGPPLHRDDLRLGRKGGSRRAARGYTRRSKSPRGGGSSISSTPVRPRNSAFSSAIPGRRAARRSAGKAMTCRWRAATGR